MKEQPTGIKKPKNHKRLIFILLISSFALLFSYVAYQYLQSNKRKAHYDSGFYIQYDNVYQLLSFIYHLPKEEPDYWKKELIRLSFNEISEFCEIVENYELDPKLDNNILESDLIPDEVDPDFKAIVTAVTEFECKERPQ